MADVQTLTVIGAGTMGRGIAQVAALGGYRTCLHDISDAILDRARADIEASLRKGVDRGKVDPAAAERARDLLVFEQRLGLAVEEADFVIEAVPEKIDLKLDTFRRVEESCPDHAILASNTSALSITEMAAATRVPSRFIGMHFFNPVPAMRLVEVVRGLETSFTALEATMEVSRRMGKDPIEVRESPGFVTSRINALIGNEAFFMLQEGVASARDIDKALQLGLNHPMGPFELVDMVGLDVRLGVLEYLHRTLGEKYRPCPLLSQYVKAGRLGRKTGRGVYDYSEEK